MAAPFSNAGPPPQPFANFFTEMSKPTHTNVFVEERTPLIQGELHQRSGLFGFMHSQPPLTPNRAFVKARTRIARSPRVGKRKPISREAELSVLVVDDIPDVTEMIALFLKYAGYDVTTVASAEAALKVASQRKFDLVISDIGMPEMSGYELAEALRHLSDYREIPIIAVTGYSEYDDRKRALKSGFNAHLTKPIDPARLLDLINELLC